MEGGLNIGGRRRKEGDGNRSTWEEEERKTRKWLDRARDDIKEKGLSGRKCMTVLHGGVCHRTSTPHKSGNMIKRKNLRWVIRTVKRTVHEVIWNGLESKLKKLSQ